MKRTQVSIASENPSSEKRQRLEATWAAEHPGKDGTTLCPRCSSINVEGLFINLEGKERGQALMNLGILGPEIESSPCPLCRLFYEVKIQNDDNLEDKDYVLYSTNPPSPNCYMDGPVLAVARGMSRGRKGVSWVRKIHRRGESRGFIASSIASGSDSHVNSLRARSIDARPIDFDIIRGWMRLCVGRHAKQCVQVVSSA